MGSTLIGAAGVLAWRDPSHAWAPASVLGILGLLLAVSGMSFLQARLAIGDETITAWWALSRWSYPLDELLTATLAPPRKWGDQAGGVRNSISPGFNPVVILVGYVVKHLFNMLAWIVLPGSSHDQVLHVIPKLGGAVPLAAISTRTNRPNDEAHHALAAVLQAIEGRQLRTASQRNLHEVPTAWSEPLPPFEGSRDGSAS